VLSSNSRMMQRGDSRRVPSLRFRLEASTSEAVLQRELDDARRADRRGDLPEGARGRGEGAIRRVEAGGVGKVEELGAEFELLGFVDVELLAQAEVPVRVARRANGADAGAAECSQRWFAERDRTGSRTERVQWVVNVAVRRAAVDGRRADLIRTRRAARVL